MRVLLLMLLIFSFAAEARYRAVPLMPTRTTADTASVKATKYNRDKPQASLASIQFGMLGGGNLSRGEALGLQWLWGGKIDYRIPMLTDRLRLRPSLGYFRKSESEGAVKITQNVVDVGLGADWVLVKSRYVDLSLGALNHLDVFLSQISLYDTSGSSPVGFRHRIAPLAGMQVHLSPTLVLAVDMEYGVITQSPMRTYGAWSAGIAFPF